MSDSSVVRTLAERVSKLENENARLKRAALLALSLIGVGVLAGFVYQQERLIQADRIETKQLVIVDEDGQSRAFMMLNQEQPGLSLTDDEGNIRLQLRLHSDGSPVVYLYGPGRAGVRASLGAGGDGAGLSLFNDDGLPGAHLTTGTVRGPNFQLLLDARPIFSIPQ